MITDFRVFMRIPELRLLVAQRIVFKALRLCWWVIASPIIAVWFLLAATTATILFISRYMELVIFWPLNTTLCAQHANIARIHEVYTAEQIRRMLNK